MSKVLTARFIAPFRNIHAPEELKEFTIFPVSTNLKQAFSPFLLTQDRGRVLNFVYDAVDEKEVQSLVGRMAMDSIHDSSLFAIAKNPILEEDDFQNLNLLLLKSLDAYIFALWVVKDNAVNIDYGILIREDPPAILKSDAYVHNTTCDGQLVDCTYSQSELSQAIAYFFVHVGSKERPSAITNEAHRVDISRYYIVLARRTDDLAIKIAHYVAALEALFSTVTIELSHTLSERIAFYIGDSDKKGIYQQMKEAYGIRSVVAHGSSFKESQMDKLLGISHNCDAICRKVFQRILTDQEQYSLLSGKNEGIDNFFKDLIFR